MIAKIEVPKNLAGSFKRVSRRIPVGLRKDEELIKTIVAYLQLGGEKLARQAVEAAKQSLELEVAQRKKKAREEALIRAAEARLAAADAESDESEEDFDDDENTDDDV
ncbi:hypothetical protein DSCA_22230 [Desulfosarcina alkanivorans]|uniref:Uncharacterized protein n=1 Tax=Desulfosarcina alkanivorans TaxID=571177 RepID=A0A5K7YIC1_9BACT|nr:hypothetical protein [Desulfosarcina alkanivorans]BBO68293.1 hypothetical protein DSCA_22230 [Desulfosarcina alkanivorans]